MRRLRPLLPHAMILICNMYVVFFLIDRVNPAMNFIDNGLTKLLLFMLCVAGMRNAWLLTRRPARPQRPAPRQPRSYDDRYRNDRPQRRYEPRRQPLYNETFERRRTTSYDRYGRG